MRDSYRDLIGDGLKGAEATKRLLNEWSASLNDPDEFPVFWLALAATQWKCGRLESHVLHQALNVIDNGWELAGWHTNSTDFTKRKVVLDKLRAELTSPQPAEKRISKRFRDTNDWQVGDLVAYRMQSGRFVILLTVGHHTDRGGTCPICELVDWTGEQLPSSFESFEIRKSNRLGPMPMTQFKIGRTAARERPDDRLQVLGVKMKSTQKSAG